MSAWKVILATLVIFGAGALTGVVLQRQLVEPVVRIKEVPANPRTLSTNHVEYLSRKLKLSPEQKQNILEIVTEGQERVKLLFGLIREDLSEEFGLVRAEILAELDAEQQVLYEELRSNPRRRRDGGRRKD